MTAARIGLIAMSGVRVHNDRLIRLGVTLPGFVERARVIASMPSLGLRTLAAVTPDEYDVTYLESPEFDPAALGPHGFDVVGISSFTAKADVMYAIADFYRARGATVVLGGLACSTTGNGDGSTGSTGTARSATSTSGACQSRATISWTSTATTASHFRPPAAAPWIASSARPPRSSAATSGSRSRASPGSSPRSSG